MEQIQLFGSTYSRASYDICLGAENVCQLALALVAPLRPDDDCSSHGKSRRNIGKKSLLGYQNSFKPRGVDKETTTAKLQKI